MDWAKNLLNREDVIVLDIESTGGSFHDEMIDLSIIELHTQNTLYNSLFKPTAPLNYYAQQVHGITHETLRFAPYLEDEYTIINEIMQNKTIITYNVAFDKRLFIQSYEKYSLKIPDNINWDCLMKVCTKLYKKQVKLDNVCEMFSVEKGTHRALPDAKAACQVIHAMAKYDNYTDN